MKPPFDLTGKRILITGASSGIGRACAVAASNLGAELVLTGRRPEALADTRSQCAGGGHVIMEGDIASSVFITQLVEGAGALDGLVHAAGIGPACPVGMLTEEHIGEVLSTNYTAFLLLMKCYSKARNRNGCFSAVAISSIAAFSGWGGVAAYSGSKGALCSSVRTLAVELSKKRIRVNAVCPGHVRTPLFMTGAASISDDESMQELLGKQPLGLGEPEQIAWPVCFLLSDAASFITGACIPVDGGFLAQ